ncbi:hypothetical protein ABH912_005773 [Pseudomonas sp. BT76 TE3572]|uniref:Uncharacterized protein n=1 Tax=Pseudomonas mandelii PD30 TaxID=1419583 RepID=A0A059L5Z6_9PSED|nr:hypothetical protein [Pseudomonas mandelii]KDD69530.1 hypothetical protein V466_08600 [Pseudomonas mandelii PD30]
MNAELTGFNLIAPKVPKSYGPAGDRLDFNNVYSDPYIEIVVPHYVGMAKGHVIRGRWASGRYKYDTDTLTINAPGPQTLKIPRLEVIDSIGGKVAVNYSVREAPGLPLLISKSLTLNVDAQDFDLAEPRLSADRKKVTVKFLNMEAGYTVRVRWYGKVIHDTDTKPIVNDSSIAFNIPSSWIQENIGKLVLINYSLHHSGTTDNLMFSKVLRVSL